MTARKSGSSTPGTTCSTMNGLVANGDAVARLRKPHALAS